MFLNCERNDLASGFNLPFKFANQIVKKKLFSCVKTEIQSTWTLALNNVLALKETILYKTEEFVSKRLVL